MTVILHLAGKPKDEKREDKRKRKEINRTAKENAQFVSHALSSGIIMTIGADSAWRSAPSCRCHIFTHCPALLGAGARHLGRSLLHHSCAGGVLGDAATSCPGGLRRMSPVPMRAPAMLGEDDLCGHTSTALPSPVRHRAGRAGLVPML